MVTVMLEIIMTQMGMVTETHMYNFLRLEFLNLSQKLAKHEDFDKPWWSLSNGIIISVGFNPYL